MGKQTSGLHMQLCVLQNAAANIVFYRLVGFVTGMAIALDNRLHSVGLTSMGLSSPSQNIIHSTVARVVYG